MSRLIESLQLRAPNGVLYENYQAARTLSKKYALAPFDLSYRNAKAEFYRGGSHKACKPHGSDFYRIWDLNIEQKNYDYLINDFYDIFLCDKRWLSEAQTVIDVEDFPLITRFENDGPYQRGNVRIEQGDVVIDAGANVGLFDILASFFNPAAVYAFEPVSDTHEQLQQTLSQNKICQRVHPVRAGLSNTSNMANISVDPNCSGASSLVIDQKCTTETVQMYSLDEWVEQNEIQKIDFIKADIEGAERLLLEGAKKVLKEFKPKLALCTYHLPDDKEVLEQLISESCNDYVIEHYAGKIFAYAKDKQRLM